MQMRYKQAYKPSGGGWWTMWQKGEVWWQQGSTGELGELSHPGETSLIYLGTPGAFQLLLLKGQYVLHGVCFCQDSQGCMLSQQRDMGSRCEHASTWGCVITPTSLVLTITSRKPWGRRQMTAFDKGTSHLARRSSCCIQGLSVLSRSLSTKYGKTRVWGKHQARDSVLRKYQGFIFS